MGRWGRQAGQLEVVECAATVLLDQPADKPYRRCVTNSTGCQIFDTFNVRQTVTAALAFQAQSQ